MDDPTSTDDPDAFVRSTYAGLYRWLRRLTGDESRAADLTQGAYAAYWASAGRRPAGVTSRAWLYAAARNLWRKQARDRKPARPIEPDRATDPNPGPDRAAEDREFETAARDAVERLPDDLREAFTLRFRGEFSFEEVGAVQGVSAGLARWRYFAARKKLSDALAPWNPGPEAARKEDRRAP